MQRKKVSITKAQEEKYRKKGLSFLRNKYATGFQLEDFCPKTKNKKKIVYGHDNPEHIRQVRKKVGGKVYPRQSYYKWKTGWKAGKNTKLLYNKRLAKENAEYIETGYSPQKRKWIENNTVVGWSENTIPHSWKVPDVRLLNRPYKIKNYKDAYFVTKKIDHNSRFATIVTGKDNLDKIRARLKYERVKKIKVQDYPKTDHSFFEFINI